MWKSTAIFCAAIGAVAVGNRLLGETDMPPPAAVQFVGETFSTDLPMAESKSPIHRVLLDCQLRDGGSGGLTLDPNLSEFDEFGDPGAVVMPLPMLSLQCTLKLIKNEKNRRLFEIRGPNIVSRLSLVAYNDIMPWGDARLLVHGKGGRVRYVIDLYIPRPPPRPSPPNSDVRSPPP